MYGTRIALEQMLVLGKVPENGLCVASHRLPSSSHSSSGNSYTQQ